MKNQIIYIETSKTERRTYIGGTSPEQHRALLANGYRHDRLANQYRKTEWQRETYQDGVLMETGDAANSEVANSNAA